LLERAELLARRGPYRNQPIRLSQQRIEFPGDIEGSQVIVAADYLTVDKDLRHGAPAAGEFDHLLARDRIVGDVDLVKGHAFAFEQGLRSDTKRAKFGRINLNLGHVLSLNGRRQSGNAGSWLRIAGAVVGGNSAN